MAISHLIPQTKHTMDRKEWISLMGSSMVKIITIGVVIVLFWVLMANKQSSRLKCNNKIKKHFVRIYSS